MTTFSSKIDLADNTRKAVIDILQACLADGVDLQTQVKQAHWNVKGPDFIALHELFDSVHGIVTEQVDLIAERIMMLGGRAMGTARVAAKNSRIGEYPLEITAGQDHAKALSDALAAFSNAARKGIDSCDEAGDAVSADVLTSVAREVDKQVWFVEAHLQATH